MRLMELTGGGERGERGWLGTYLCLVLAGKASWDAS